jgi:hypothetical protein
MKDITFNDYKFQITEKDIDQILAVIGKGCHLKTLIKLKSVLTYGKHRIPFYGILERLTKENDEWFYCAGQSYPDEIRTIRELLLK